MVSMSRIVMRWIVFSPRLGVYSGKNSRTCWSMLPRQLQSSAIPSRIETMLLVTENTLRRLSAVQPPK